MASIRRLVSVLLVLFFSGARAAAWSVAERGTYRYSFVAPNFVAEDGFPVKTGDRVIFRMSAFVPAEGHHALPVAECEEDEDFLDSLNPFEDKETKTFDTGGNKKPMPYSSIDVELFFTSSNPRLEIKLPLHLARGQDLTFVAPADGTIQGAGPINFTAARTKRDEELKGICGEGFKATKGPEIGRDTTDQGLAIPWIICRSGISTSSDPECAR
jgi:hypothetical protein